MAVERIFPDRTGSFDIVDLKEHVARYEFASKFVKDGISGLDVACGAGYGTKMLIRGNTSRFYGVDVSEEAIQYAKSHYPNARIEFIKQDATQLSFKPQSFDLIVSFETIEHLEREKGKQLLKTFHSLLKNDGALILSCPNRETYPQDYNVNPHHKYEYSYKEILELIKTYFSDIDTYCQQVRYFKRLPKKTAQFIKHLPSPVISFITNIAKRKYTEKADLGRIGWISRILLYEYHFGHNVFPYIEDYGAYKPSCFVFICKKPRNQNKEYKSSLSLF